jgi:hypothetical protein
MKRTLMTIAAVLISTSVALAGGVQLRADVSKTPRNFKKGEAVLQVTTLNCGTPKTLPLEGRAEGVVNGRRQTVPLKVTKTGAVGVYDVAAQWPAEGRWVLIFTTREYGQHGSLIVELGTGGGFTAVSEKDDRGTLRIEKTELVWGKVMKEKVEKVLKG